MRTPRVRQQVDFGSETRQNRHGCHADTKYRVNPKPHWTPAQGSEPQRKGGITPVHRSFNEGGFCKVAKQSLRRIVSKPKNMNFVKTVQSLHNSTHRLHGGLHGVYVEK